MGIVLFVFPLLVKSLYKTYYLNIPYFMRVRKRLNAEKIRKIGWNPGIWAIFLEPWCCRSGCRFPGTPCPWRSAGRAWSGVRLNWRFVGGVSCRCPQWCSSGRTFLVAPCWIPLFLVPWRTWPCFGGRSCSVLGNQKSLRPTCYPRVSDVLCFAHEKFRDGGCGVGETCSQLHHLFPEGNVGVEQFQKGCLDFFVQLLLFGRV